MDHGSRIRDDLPVNLPYDGPVAEACDCWLQPGRDYRDRVFYREAIEQGGGPALELGGGNGRLLVDGGVPRSGFDAEWQWRIRRSATREHDGVTFIVDEALWCDIDAHLQRGRRPHVSAVRAA